MRTILGVILLVLMIFILPVYAQDETPEATEEPIVNVPVDTVILEGDDVEISPKGAYQTVLIWSGAVLLIVCGGTVYILRLTSRQHAVLVDKALGMFRIEDIERIAGQFVTGFEKMTQDSPNKFDDYIALLTRAGYEVIFPKKDDTTTANPSATSS